MSLDIEIRDAKEEEYQPLGELLAKVYAHLPGFPSPDEQPKYYEILYNIGDFAQKNKTRVLVAVENGVLLGGLVYFGDMREYGAGGSAHREKNASGIRLLGIDEKARGRGVGRALTLYCIELAKQAGHNSVVLHTTKAMRIAWKMYENLGFKRDASLDFLQRDLPVFGFRLKLQ